jgi:hypothetical protein
MNTNKLSENVNFLYYLKYKYNEDLNAEHFCMISCPYKDIKNKYIKNCDVIRTKLSEITSKLDSYEEACRELDRIKTLDPNLPIDDDKYREILYNRKIYDCERYNMLLYMTYIIGIGLSHVAKYIDSNTSN